VTPLTTDEGPDTPDGELEIRHIDVGQADATLLVGPGGETMLIDSGGIDTPVAARRSRALSGLDATAARGRRPATAVPSGCPSDEGELWADESRVRLPHRR